MPREGSKTKHPFMAFTTDETFSHKEALLVSKRLGFVRNYLFLCGQ
jgi:hypothetical protein